MPLVIDNDFAEENGQVATLSLDENNPGHFSEHLANLIEIASGSSILPPSLMEDSSSLDRVDHAYSVISSLLAKIIDSSASAGNQEILTKCISVLVLATKHDEEILDSNLSKKLVTLLIKNTYPTACDNLCKLLTWREYEVTDEESKDLERLFYNSSSSQVLKLLTSSGSINPELVNQVITKLKSASVNSSSYPLYKDHFFIIAQGISSASSQDDRALAQLQDFFKACSEQTITAEVTKLFKGSSFFDPILKEIQDNILTITRLLAKDRLSIVANKQSSEGTTAKSELKNLVRQPDTIIAESTAKTISCDFKEISITNKTWPVNLCYSKMVNLDLTLKKVFDNDISNTSLIDTYQQYLLEILHSSYLSKDKKTYPRWLISNIYFCNILLTQKYDLSQQVTESLINSCQDNWINLPSHIHHISLIISQLLVKNKMPSLCAGKSIELLKKSLDLQNLPTITNIAASFQRLALLNIHDDAFTNKTCQKYLLSSSDDAKEAILTGLQNIAVHSDRLPGGTIYALASFIEDGSQKEALRIKALELLQIIARSIPALIISELSHLLAGEKKIEDATFAPQGALFSMPQGIDKVQLVSYLQLEKFVSSNHFKIKTTSSSGNDLITSIADQVSLFAQGLSPSTILTLLTNELTTNQAKYQSFFSESNNIERCLQDLTGQVPLTGNGEEAVLAAAANSLKVDINIYHFDGIINNKKAIENPYNRQINLAFLDGHYLSLVKTAGASSKEDAARDDTVKVDYKIAQSIARLLENYAKATGSLPSTAISYLEQALTKEELSQTSLAVLNIIAVKSPYLLNANLLEYVKEQDASIGQQILYQGTIGALERLVFQDSSSVDAIKDQIEKLAASLTNSSQAPYGPKLDWVAEIISKALTKYPLLFKECLQVTKLINPTKLNSAVIDLLLDFKEVNYQDLCWFVDHGCQSSKLRLLLENYFNDNFLAIKDSPDILASLLASLHMIAFNTALQAATIDNLIILAKQNRFQRVNIVKILLPAFGCLKSSDFNLLEELFVHDDVQLSSMLFKLFAKANKHLSTPNALSSLFKNLSAQTPLKILPSGELKEEAQTLLKLKTVTIDSDKLTLLEGLQKPELQPETVKTVLGLAKNKILAKLAIKIIANLAIKPLLDQEISEIICLSKRELPFEYKQLQPFLSIEADEFRLTNDQLIVKNLLEKKFTNLSLTSFLIEKIDGKLSALNFTKEFIDKIILGDALSKAITIDEFDDFVEFLRQNKLEETEIARYLQEPTLAKLVDILETKILSLALQDLKTQGLTVEVLEITYLSYQLKANGWQAKSIAEVLKKIRADNINYIREALQTLYNYHILDTHRDQRGNSVLEIINKVPAPQMEAAVFAIACNQFKPKQENKGEELVEKFVQLNPQLRGKAAEYLGYLREVHSKYVKNRIDKPIQNWHAGQIKDWAIKFKAAKQNTDHSRKSSVDAVSNARSWPKEEITEVIAVLERANNLHTAKAGKDGHLLRDTQIIALLLLLDSEKDASGKLLQVATGEGKSTISAMLAAILALYGFKVDIVTSSPVLAKSGKESAAGFFESLGLSCGLNTEKGQLSGEKACYDLDIVYGDALNFQSDFLSNTSNQGPRRGSRELSVTIVDEVDSMLLDGSNNFAKQATPTPLMEYLLPILTIAWHNFYSQILPLALEEELCLSETTKMLEHLINSLPIPQYLKPYANHQAKHWAKSLIGAATRWELDRDYVININSEGKKVIHPVDSSTGVTQESMVWQNGLHQFLQIKHSVRLSAETLSCFFITNISYFQQYDKILGMTGTLGSRGSQEFLKTVYGVELAFVPTYKDKQLIELPARLETTEDGHIQAIIESSYQEAVTHCRAVLVVCKTIKDVDEVIIALKHRCGRLAKIINYSRSEERLYNREVEQITYPGTIIVATNLAGRGTDIRTSAEVEAHGGLHVISTFLAKNARDEAQVKGRTSRQGNCGSYQIIALDRSCYDLNSIYSSGEEVINIKRQAREERELQYIHTSLSDSIPKFISQDNFYNEFSKLYSELSGSAGDFWTKNAKIKQLIEDFGLWLKLRNDNDGIDDFLSKARNKFASNNFTNPSYLVTQHYGVTGGYTLLNSLEPGLKIEDIYNFAAHYYAAKAYLSMGERPENYKVQAIESLMEAVNRLSELISYLTSMAISVSKSGTTLDNELLQQVTSKVAFFKEFMARIDTAIEIIQRSGDKEIRVKSVVTTNELAEGLSKADIAEIDFLGIDMIFEVEAYKPKKNWNGSIFAGCCAIVQMAVGGLVTIGSLGLASQLGISIFSSGLMDAYKVASSISKGQPIKLEDYLTGKAIDYALIGAQVGFSKMAPGKNMVEKKH